jgi:hypothetical protein
MTEGMTALDLAEDLGMLQDDDVQHVVVEYLGLDLHDEVIPAAVCAEVRDILDPVGERTAPAPLYWGPGHPRSWAGESPTAGEGDYEGMFDW